MNILILFILILFILILFILILAILYFLLSAIDTFVFIHQIQWLCLELSETRSYSLSTSNIAIILKYPTNISESSKQG
jgi:hypothetical protein